MLLNERVQVIAKIFDLYKAVPWWVARFARRPTHSLILIQGGIPDDNDSHCWQFRNELCQCVSDKAALIGCSTFSSDLFVLPYGKEPI